MSAKDVEKAVHAHGEGFGRQKGTQPLQLHHETSTEGLFSCKWPI